MQDPVAAFCFDKAITMFGIAVENDVRDATKNAQKPEQIEKITKRVIDHWMLKGIRSKKDEEQPSKRSKQMSF